MHANLTSRGCSWQVKVASALNIAEKKKREQQQQFRFGATHLGAIKSLQKQADGGRRRGRRKEKRAKAESENVYRHPTLSSQKREMASEEIFKEKENEF